MRRLTAVGYRYYERVASGADVQTLVLEDDAGICVMHAARGGGKIYVAHDESVLFVGSMMDYEAGLAAFRAGTRTPPEKFTLSTP
ncbi:hypothetical protein ITJ66_16650 [Plantibacter sp. VKM Ac-2885]|nr:hypothetical protein [Plantibacter sp. VKM Ac-2885]